MRKRTATTSTPRADPKKPRSHPPISVAPHDSNGSRPSEVVGLLAYAAVPPVDGIRERSCVFVHELAVSESCRRRGIATTLLSHLVEVVAPMAQDVHLLVDVDNAAANRLYQKLHFGEPLCDQQLTTPLANQRYLAVDSDALSIAADEGRLTPTVASTTLLHFRSRDHLAVEGLLTGFYRQTLALVRSGRKGDNTVDVQRALPRDMLGRNRPIRYIIAVA